MVPTWPFTISIRKGYAQSWLMPDSVDQLLKTLYLFGPPRPCRLVQRCNAHVFIVISWLHVMKAWNATVQSLVQELWVCVCGCV